MSSQCYIMNVNKVISNQSVEGEAKPMSTQKVMSYEEKTVGSTSFFKCEACPYMALAEDDIKFHLFTEHPDLAKRNGLAENIQIACPGCTSVFDAEETLRTHLRNHHKMGIKDVRKMVKSLVQMALKNAILKKEEKLIELPPPPVTVSQEIDVKIPQVIEIVPDVVNTVSAINVNANKESLPKGVAFISVDELHKMSTPNFEKVDPKEIIQEASINIVYTTEVSTQYVNVSNPSISTTCNIIQMSSVPPDLISSIQPRVTAVVDNTVTQPAESTADTIQIQKKGRPKGANSFKYTEEQKDGEIKVIEGLLCGVDHCHCRLKNEDNIAYHRKCHQNGKLQCPECSKICLAVEALHTHLWKSHAVDMELPTCEICGFKTYKKYRLYNIHMRCHGKLKSYSCPICSKVFKNAAQMSKHKLSHSKDGKPVVCPICQNQFNSEQRLKVHVARVHEKLRPYKCSECDYTAARKDEVNLHLRSHTGDKPYSCDQCMYCSADHNSLRRHKKTHTKEAVYHCKYCPFTSIQSTQFASHMISKHPNVNSNDVHRCPYCPFKSVNKSKYVLHLTTHPDKEGIQLLIEMTNGSKNKPSWTIPSETADKHSTSDSNNDQNKEPATTDTTIDVETYDCDSLSEGIPQNYPKNYVITAPKNVPEPDFNNQVLMQDLSKDDNNSDCLISESSNDTLIDRHQFTPQMPLQISYDNNESNLHAYLNPTVSIQQNLIQSNNVSPLVTSHSPINNNMNSIMSNFPIRLPLAPQVSMNNNITLKPLDKIPLPLTEMTGRIIKPTQILPVPSSSNSPVHITNETEGVPRKKPKISVKSNLILKGPDEVNMFHSQQKLAFKQLEDNERYGLGGPVTFNNLITTQFMQLQPEPTLSESPSNIMPYPQENMCDSSTPLVETGTSSSSQIFTFNQQMNVNQMTLLPSSQKIQTNDPSYIKLEATIKQNTQSPSLERMCSANLINPSISLEYKASPPLEDIHKNMNEIKNEVKSDTYYMTLSNSATNPALLDQYLMDNIIGEQYSGHLDLSAVPLPEVSDDQQNDVIEIDDNSDDNKLLPRFDMNFPLESLYLMHDFHFLDNEPPPIANEVTVTELSRMVTEIPIINKENIDVPSESMTNEFQNFIQGKKDPMMNTSVRLSTNKINVKNIELMKN